MVKSQAVSQQSSTVHTRPRVLIDVNFPYLLRATGCRQAPAMTCLRTTEQAAIVLENLSAARRFQ